MTIVILNSIIIKTNMNNIITLLSVGSLLLLLFLAFANPNKVNTKANFWFGLFLTSIFIVNLEEFFIILNIDIKNQLVVNSFSLPANFIAPFFYLSICYFINPNRKWKAKDYFHFLFGIIFFAVLIAITFLFTEKNVSRNDAEIIKIVSLSYQILNYSFILLLLIYGFLTYKKLKKHQQNIKIFSSNTENIDLKWLENIVIIVNGLLLIWIIDMSFEISSHHFSLINFFLLFGVFFIAYDFIKQKEIYPFLPNQKEEIIEIIEELNSSDNRKKLISDEKLEENKSELLKIMTLKKPFLDSEFSLIKLANELQTTPHLISYTINNGFNENFYQFINRYRIEESKKLLLDPSKNNLTLIGIGYEVGFNSKSAFNTTFKKITGKTPSEFKKVS